MRRRWIVLSSILVAGCSDSTPRPINVARPVNTESPADVVVLPAATDAPPTSDPAAVELVHRALDAHTDGDRAIVRKLQTVEYVRKGVGKGLENNPLGLTWTVSSAWPDRFKLVAEFPGPRLVTLAWTPDAGWQRPAENVPAVPLGPTDLTDYKRDASGEWVWLLFPLLDSAAVLAPADPISIRGGSAPGVKLFCPRLAPCVVHFDPETHLLARISFEGRESGQPGMKVYDVIDVKPFHGIKLPARLAQSFRGRQYADWTLTRLDPKPGFADNHFTMPK